MLNSAPENLWQLLSLWYHACSWHPCCCYRWWPWAHIMISRLYLMSELPNDLFFVVMSFAKSVCLLMKPCVHCFKRITYLISSRAYSCSGMFVTPYVVRGVLTKDGLPLDHSSRIWWRLRTPNQPYDFLVILHCHAADDNCICCHRVDVCETLRLTLLYVLLYLVSFYFPALLSVWENELWSNSWYLGGC